MRGWMLVAVMGLGVAGAGAQMGTAGQATAAAQVSPAKAFDALLTSFEKEVMAAAKAMPADKYNFSPDSLHIAGAQFAGVRTFAGQVTHIAEVNYMLAGALMGSKPKVDMHAIGEMTSKEECVKALEESFVAAHQGIATVTVANENDAGAMGLSKAALAGYLPVHGFDHYGQMVEYLRMNGIVPPASAK